MGRSEQPRDDTFLFVEGLAFGFESIIEMLSDDFPQGLSVGLFSRVLEYVLVVEDPSCGWKLAFAATFVQVGLDMRLINSQDRCETLKISNRSDR